MANYNPVLDRPMFRNRDATDDTTSDDLKIRREQAAALIDQAKKKFDPSNFQMLDEQERPQVFRPVAVNMPAQQQTANTAQRMQQMAAQGVPQPVQMAIGGLAAYAKGGFHSGTSYGPYAYTNKLAQLGAANDPRYNQATDYGLPSYGSDPTVEDLNAPTVTVPSEKIAPTIRPQNPGVVQYSLPDVGLRIGKEGEAGITMLKPEVEGVVDSRIPTPSNAEKKQKQSPATWSDDDINDIAYDIYNSRVGELHGTEAKTPIGRGIQSLNPFRSSPDHDAIVQDLKNKRDIAQKWQSGMKATTLRSEQEDRIAEAMGANPVKSVFAEQTPEERNKAIDTQNAAVEKAEAPPVSPPATNYSNVPPVSPPIAQPAGMDTFATTAPTSEGIASLAPEGTGGGSSFSAVDTTEKTPSSVVPPAARPINQTLNVGSPQTEGGQVPASDATMAALKAYNSGSGSEQVPFPETGKTALTMDDIKNRRNQERQDNFNLALMQAGLAIAGGKSSNALTNIGEGGMQGVQMFAKGEQENRVLERERMADLRAQQQQEMDRAYRINELANRYAQMGLEGKKLDFEISNAGKMYGLKQNEQEILRSRVDAYSKGLDARASAAQLRIVDAENSAISKATMKANEDAQAWAQKDQGMSTVLDPVKRNLLISNKADELKKQYLPHFRNIERAQSGYGSGLNNSDPLALFPES
jgi:hypothetical protein